LEKKLATSELTEGTRKLGLFKTFLYGESETLPKWGEIYLHKGNWEHWCGKEGVTSTQSLQLIKIIDLPK